MNTTNERVTQNEVEVNPIALQVFKRGRWCTVAKVTFLHGEPILGIAHRYQHGVDSTLSVPIFALEFAEAHGCCWLYFRRDLTREAWRISLADVRKRGYLGPGAGAEYYIRIEAMEEVAFPNWLYADKVIRLGEEPKTEPAAGQLPLALEVKG